jgi:probable rRNA maturation factor
VNDDPSKPAVDLSDRQDLAVDARSLIDLARRTLEAEGAAGVELSISLVDEEEMAALHQRYADAPGPTDVLSFPLEDEFRDGERRLLGDVVICPAVAARQNTDLGAELRLLLAHGILHLLGYDHEEDADRDEMWARQERYSGVSL